MAGEVTTFRKLGDIPSPREYGLPHESWRPSQYQMVQTLLGKKEGSVTLMQAPTGSGKTGISRGVAGKKSVTALVKTKMLQQTNYDGIYKFDILFGRGNYDCIHPEQMIEDAKADQCLYESRMDECEYVDECPYVMRKRLVQRSRVRSLNYSYFLTSRWTRNSKFATDYLFLDECHLLSDETVEWVGLTVRDSDRLKWGLPSFPTTYQSTKEGVDRCLDWAEQAIGVLETKLEGLTGKDANTLSKKSRIERLVSKLTFTCSAIHRAPHDWYCRAGERALEYMGTPRPGLMIKPLTARHHFPKLFLGIYPRVVMMSATIGAPEFMAEELGIEHWEYEQVPNQWGPEQRPVHVPECPSLGYKSPDSHWVKQAEIIKAQLEALPEDWCGVIHTNSYAQATNLAKRLDKLNFNTMRLYLPRAGTPTNQQLSDWEMEKKRYRGRLIITPSFSEGVDLTEERICIVAKTPFASVSPGSFDYERMLYSSSMYKQRTAWKTEQMCGRTRRGREIDYDTSFEKRGWVSVVDGAFVARGVRKHCSRDFVEALVYC